MQLDKDAIEELRRRLPPEASETIDEVLEEMSMDEEEEETPRPEETEEMEVSEEEMMPEDEEEDPELDEEEFEVPEFFKNKKK